MRRRSSLREIALSNGSVVAGANRIWIVSGNSKDSATNRNARVLGRTAPTLSSFEVTPPLVRKQAGSRGKLPVSRLTMRPDQRTISCDHLQIRSVINLVQFCPRRMARVFF
jgi:hypothetical protein